tara:strand:- start:206 stop:961 length:756 start_codon:yes stop_codon:yes gene_type:complete
MNNYNTLYLFGGDPDNHFVRQMIEKGLILTSDGDAYPRFRIDTGKHEIFFEEAPHMSVGGFGWRNNWIRFKRQRISLSKEPFAKAIGLKNLKNNNSIVDLSCGTGKDSLLLMRFGGRVKAFERNEIIFWLLKYYEYDLKDDLIIDSDAIELELGSIKFEGASFIPDVIYFDPMYGTEVNSKALPRKQIANFRSFVGIDADYIDTLRSAISLAKDRVVIKRSNKADIIFPNIMTHSFKGKSTRYDVYIRANR